MIEKILDKYFYKQLKNKIIRYMNIMYFMSLNYKISYKNDRLILDIKKSKYSNDNYIRCITINKEYFLSNIINFDKLMIKIDDTIKLYKEEENG